MWLILCNSMAAPHPSPWGPGIQLPPVYTSPSSATSSDRPMEQLIKALLTFLLITYLSMSRRWCQDTASSDLNVVFYYKKKDAIM